VGATAEPVGCVIFLICGDWRGAEGTDRNDNF
jgi:hypothetical protein